MHEAVVCVVAFGGERCAVILPGLWLCPWHP